MAALPVQAQEVRKWSDSTGRFSLQAKLVSVAGGKVTLARQDGSKVTIPLERLSKEDQAYLANQAAENPFQPAEESPPVPGSAPPAKELPSTGPRTVKVDWSESQLLSMEPASPDWKITPPTPPEAGFRPKSIALPPKTDFFEKLCGMAVNLVAKKAVVGYTLEKHGSESSTRILIGDLVQGRILATATASGQMAPLALHDDGKHVLMRRNEFGFGNLDRLEIWSIQGKEVVRSLTWTPYHDVTGAPRDVLWAEFTDAMTLATSSRGGRVALWNVATAQPLCHFETSDGAVPALSSDRQWIAFSGSEKFGVFNVAKREIAVMQGTPCKLQWPAVAFSPSGRKIGCIAFDRILVWDTATGQLEKNFSPQGIMIHGAVDFPDDGFLLANNQFLIALETQIKLWHYRDAEPVRTVGGTTFLAVAGFNAPGVLAAAKLPHTEAASLLEKALKQPDLFVFHKGTPVKLNAAGIAEPHRTKVIASLTPKLAALQCPIQAEAAVEIVASVDPAKPREISFWHSGDYKVTEYRTWLRFVYQGKTAWETSGTNIPGMLSLKKGENVEGVLRKLSEQPSYAFFDHVVLPEFLQKPSASPQPGAGQTLGNSPVTAAGLR